MYPNSFLMSRQTEVFGEFDSHASALIPVKVFPPLRPSPRRCQRLTSISGSSDNGHHAMLHTCGSAPGMSIRGSRRTKGCFSGCTGHHSALVWPRACRTALCVMGAGVPRFGPRGVNSGYGHPVPGGQRTPLVSHGVTVGRHRPTRCYNVITPNQRGFMNSSLCRCTGHPQTNHHCSFSLLGGNLFLQNLRHLLSNFVWSFPKSKALASLCVKKLVGPVVS